MIINAMLALANLSSSPARLAHMRWINRSVCVRCGNPWRQTWLRSIALLLVADSYSDPFWALDFVTALGLPSHLFARSGKKSNLEEHCCAAQQIFVSTWIICLIMTVKPSPFADISRMKRLAQVWGLWMQTCHFQSAMKHRWFRLNCAIKLMKSRIRNACEHYHWSSTGFGDCL